MFCPNCGKEIPQNAAVCPYCGTAIKDDSANTFNQADDKKVYSGEVEDAVKVKDGLLNYLKPIVVAVITIVVVVFITSKLFGGNYKEPVKEWVDLCNKGKESELLYNKLNQPEFVYSFTKVYNEALEDSDYDNNYKEAYESIFDNLEDEYGEDFKIKLVKIKNVEKMDKDDLRDYQDEMREYAEDKEDREDLVDEMEEALEALEDNYDLSSKSSKKILKAYSKMLKKMSKVKVTKGYEIDIEIKIKGEDGKAKYKEKNVMVLKVDGDWIFANEHTPSTLYYGFE